MREMRETMDRVARDDFYQNRGSGPPPAEIPRELPPVAAERCFCCPGGISRGNAECMLFRKKSYNRNGHRNAQAGRYPVDKKFPCEECGKVEEHRHA